MGNLSCFLSQNAIKAENEKFVASKRFLGPDNKPVEWEIQAITSTEDEKLRRVARSGFRYQERKPVYQGDGL